MYRVSINDKSFQVDFKGEHPFIDGQQESWDLVAVDKKVYHIIKGHQSYSVEVLSVDLNKKELRLKINGILTEISIQDKYDLLLEKLGMQQTHEVNTNEIKAPMPGLILEILVKEGQAVAKGDKLLILEAMKMENVIKSAGEGTIKGITVAAGDNVEKNQVLIQF